MRLEESRGLLEWRLGGRSILTYSFGSDQYKAYVRDLRTLAGTSVLRDSPADHRHHHALMYAVRVNGINFWEEIDRPGVQRHVAMLSSRAGTNAAGQSEATLTELIHWVAPEDRLAPDSPAVALLIEHRTLTLSVDEGQGEVALEWRAEFTVGTRTNRVTLHGTDYNGLGLRFPAAWDRTARHENSDHLPYLTHGKRDVFPGWWASVTGPPPAPGREAQVAVGSDPRTAAGTNMLFSMTEPFTYLALTQGLDRQPLEYRSGDKFRLGYLVLALDRPRSPAELERRFRHWAGTRPGRP